MAGHVIWSEKKSLKLKHYTVLVAENSANKSF